MTAPKEDVRAALETLPAFVRKNRFETTESGHLSLDSQGPAQKRVEVEDPADALLVTAKREDGTYALLLDIDFPVEVRTSSSGNSHLYFDVHLERSHHNMIIAALVDAGVVQPTWGTSARKNAGGSHLRPPWVRKGEDLTLNQEASTARLERDLEHDLVDRWAEALAW